jgi:hypothetical protein
MFQKCVIRNDNLEIWLIQKFTLEHYNEFRSDISLQKIHVLQQQKIIK